MQVLPAPEVADDQLETWRNLLESGSKVPDVYGIDVIWPGILADNLIDLNNYVPGQELAAYFPELVRNNTVNGRLVALPYNLGEGLLFYRVDLLHKYGYTVPPKTWDELEKMAKRIQAGERAKGNKDFWGYVWQGGPSEALTCDALEWQVSEGGGTILDERRPSCAIGQMPMWPPGTKTRPRELSLISRLCRQGRLVRPQPWEGKATVFRAILCIRARL